MNAAFGLRFFVAIFPPLLIKFLTIEFISNVLLFVSIFFTKGGLRGAEGACPSAVRGRRCVRFLPRGKSVLEKMDRIAKSYSPQFLIESHQWLGKELL